MVWDDDSLSPEVQPMSLPETHCWAVVCGTKIWTVKFSSLSRQQDYVMLPTGLCLKHGSELAAPVSGIYSPFAQQLPQNTSHRTHINTSDLVGGGKLELLTRDQPFSTTAQKKKKRKKKEKCSLNPSPRAKTSPVAVMEITTTNAREWALHGAVDVTDISPLLPTSHVVLVLPHLARSSAGSKEEGRTTGLGGY